MTAPAGLGRRGLTRTETAVAVSALTLLAGLATVAAPRARESARLAHCGTNLRQIGLALQSYADAHGSLPPAAVWRPEGDAAALDTKPWTGGDTRTNWVALLLPHLTAETPSAAFDHDAPVIDPRNAPFRTADLPAWRCPSDEFNRPDNRYLYREPGGREAEFARGNYAINGGPQLLARRPGTPSSPAADGYDYETSPDGGFRWWGSGVAGFNVAFRPDEFGNGQSATVVAEEIRAGVHRLDPRGVWAFGQIAGSITWGHGVTGDDFGPNNTSDRADDVLGCGEIHKTLGAERLAEFGMPCCWYWNFNSQATARSRHPGGAQVLMADGAVRFVADTVDPCLWHALHSRETPAGRITDEDLASLDAPAPTDREEPQQPARPKPPVDVAPGTRIVNSVGMELTLLPAGEFTMGVPDAGEEEKTPDEARPHRVRFTRSFYMGTFEVTQEEYEKVVGSKPALHTSGRAFAGLPPQDTGRLPVEDVTWEQAVEFCRRLSERPEERAAGLSYRLPTEAEWEYACRAGTSEPYRFVGASAATGANAGNAIKEPLGVTAVGSYPPNTFGLCDLRGNVYEWCADRFARDYYRRSPAEDPSGPASGLLRVVRGGDWLFVGEGCMINRRVAPEWRSSGYLGFRVVADFGPGHDPSALAADSRLGRYELATFGSMRNPADQELLAVDPFRRTARLVRRSWNTTPAITPDGRSVASVDGRDLFVVALAGGEPRNLTGGRFDAVVTPAWRPDRDEVAFAAKQAGGPWRLYVTTTGGQNPRPLLRSEANASFPTFSPDGSRMLFVSGADGTWPDVRLLSAELDGTEPLDETSCRDLLGRAVPHDAAPAWHPDGRRFAFADWGATREWRRIAVHDPATEKSQFVTPAEEFCVYPAWSPDGRYLAYVRYPAGPGDGRRGDLCLLDTETGERRTVTAGTLPAGEHARPSWNPAPRDLPAKNGGVR